MIAYFLATIQDPFRFQKGGGWLVLRARAFLLDKSRQYLPITEFKSRRVVWNLVEGDSTLSPGPTVSDGTNTSKIFAAESVETQ